MRRTKSLPLRFWNRLRGSTSVRQQFVLAFLLLVCGVLVLTNTYPVIALRDTTFANKRTALLNQVSTVAASLGAMDTLSTESIAQVLDLLDFTGLDRIVVTDARAMILYDSAEDDSESERYARFPELLDALKGNTTYYHAYAENTFFCRSAMPILVQGQIIGGVYLSDEDADQGQVLHQVQSTLFKVSLAAGIAATLVALLLTGLLTRRITALVCAIHIVRDGAYDYRIQVRGDDELSELGREFNKLTQRLQNTEEMRRRFVSDASHELKTPLASIRLLTDSIVQSENMDMDTMREFVADIGEEAERLGRTTEKLLRLTRIDSTIPQMPEPVDMKAVAERALLLLRPLAEAKQIALHCSLAEHCRILASHDDLYQIIFNLAENAVKYTPDGGRVSLRLYPENDQAVLEVEDTGIGISQEDLPHIFSRFYRVDKARSRASGGSGLGLAIVHDTVVLHGGTVEVRSTPGRGSCFTVRFPLYGEKA